MKTTQKLAAILAGALAAAIFTGCTPNVEIEDRAIVHAIGVDKSEEGYEVSLQVFATGGSGSDTPIDPSQPNMKIISGKGDTIYEGVKQCELILGSDAFIGHNKLILFGKSLYNEDMDKLLDWFRKENENYLGVTVAYSETSAKDVLNVPLTEGSSTIENLDDIMKYAVTSGETVECDLLRLTNDLALPMGEGLVPVISVVEEKGGQQGGKTEGGSGGGGSSGKEQESVKHLRITKTAVLKDKKAVGIIDADEAAGVLWITGKMKKNAVMLSTEEQSFNAEIKKRYVKDEMELKDGKPVLNLRIYAEMRIAEDVGDDVKKEASQLAEKKILEQCRKAAEKLLDEYKTDGLNIAKRVKFYLPTVYKSFEQDFDRLISATEINIYVRCDRTD